jgi:hypothetical protein
MAEVKIQANQIQLILKAKALVVAHQRHIVIEDDTGELSLKIPREVLPFVIPGDPVVVSLSFVKAKVEAQIIESALPKLIIPGAN